MDKWYYVEENQAIENVQGPVSLTEMSILINSQTINQNALVWKSGMSNWTRIEDAQFLHEQINQLDKLQENADKQVQDDDENILDLLEHDPEKVLQNQVNEQLKKLFYHDNGLWNIVDEKTNFVKQQKDEPKQLIEQKRVQLEQFYEQTLFKKKENKQKQKKDLQEIQDVGLTADQIKKREKNRMKTKRQNQKKKEKWYEAKQHTYVYVMGLPGDISQQEVLDFFEKQGSIRKDPVTQEHKIKIYRDDQGRCKGDAKLSYQKEESVALALELLHDREIKAGYKLSVQIAKFEQKGEYKVREGVTNAQKKEEKILTAAQKKMEQQLQYGWEEAEDVKGLQIVILKNMFTQAEADKHTSRSEFFQELKQDVQLECEEKLGLILRIRIFQNNPEGIIELKFKEAESAMNCIQLMNGRYYGEQIVQCFYWDGKTDYQKNFVESTESEEKRIEEFGQWIKQ